MNDKQKLFYAPRPVTDALLRVESEHELRQRLLETIGQFMKADEEHVQAWILEEQLTLAASPNVNDWERWGFASQDEALAYGKRHTRHIFHAFTNILTEAEMAASTGGSTVRIHEAMQRIGFSLFGGWVQSQIAEENL